MDITKIWNYIDKMGVCIFSKEDKFKKHRMKSSLMVKEEYYTQ